MKNHPINMNIELTTKCPLNCSQCYCNLNTGKDIDIETARYWLKEAGKHHVESIYLSGGETLCYPYLYEILEDACKVCSNVNIAISGYGFDKILCDRIMSTGINGISVSLNGSTKEINDKTRDGFDYAINALSILKESNYANTIINWVMHSCNCDDFIEMIRLAESYKVNQIIIFGFKPDRNMQLNTQPSYTQMKNIANIVRNYSGKIKINVESCFSPLLAIIGETKAFGNLNIGINKGCLAGISRFSVNVDGLLSPCRHLELFEKYETLEDYWNSSPTLQKIRLFHKNKEEPCKKCYYSQNCRPCLAVENKINGKLYSGNRMCPVALS